MHIFKAYTGEGFVSAGIGVMPSLCLNALEMTANIIVPQASSDQQSVGINIGKWEEDGSFSDMRMLMEYRENDSIILMQISNCPNGGGNCSFFAEEIIESQGYPVRGQWYNFSILINETNITMKINNEVVWTEFNPISEPVSSLVEVWGFSDTNVDAYVDNIMFRYQPFGDECQ